MPLESTTLMTERALWLAGRWGSWGWGLCVGRREHDGREYDDQRQ